MSSAYFDTSVLFKLLLDEPGAAEARAAWASAEQTVCSRLAFVETRSALAAARRARRMDDEAHEELKRRFAELMVPATVVEVDEPLTEIAADLAEAHALRGYDAVHLAAALSAGAEVFVSSDADQLRAASTELLTVLDPAGAP